MKSGCGRAIGSWGVLLGCSIILFGGCGSTSVKGLLVYPDGVSPTEGDSVHVRLYGSSTCGVTILNVGKDHKWQYPPSKKNLRQWSDEKLPSFKSGKEEDGPVFVFQAVKEAEGGVISTQAQRMQYSEYLQLPDSARVIRLIYEASVPVDSTHQNEADDLESSPK